MNLVHFGIEIVPLGDNADPRRVVALARAAEQAGWEAVFVWDHLGFVWDAPSADPWVVLAAVAQATERIRIGTAVTPLPRHRPHVLANVLATLDQLSGGRVVFGAGLGGVADEFTAFGETGEPAARAALLDEGLAVMDQLWSGATVDHHGAAFTVAGVTLAPLPVQRPRVPVWIGGDSRPALRRAARWDGWIVGGADQVGEMVVTVEQMAERLAYVNEHRSVAEPFDVAITGWTTPTDATRPDAFATAGVTWWLESLHEYRGTFDTLMERVEAGPPR